MSIGLGGSQSWISWIRISISISDVDVMVLHADTLGLVLVAAVAALAGLQFAFRRVVTSDLVSRSCSYISVTVTVVGDGTEI